MLRVRLSLLLAVCWIALALSAGAAPPTVSHIFPAGGQRGTKVTVTCSGGLDPWPVSVFAPGVEVAAAADKGKLEITIPADLAADRVWIRLYNAEGAAPAVPFLIGGLKEQSETEPNNAPTNAMALDESSLVINGVLEGADVDGFSVPLAAGQTLVADLDAFNALGSPMDAILQVTAPDGAVLAENHDDVELDPRLAFTARRAGRHIVRLFAYPSAPDTSISYRGAANYVYRLTLTTGPYITHAGPMTAPLTGPGTVEVFGWNIAPGTQLPVVPLLGPNHDHATECESLADLRNSSLAKLGLAFSPQYGGAARVRLVPFASVPGLVAPDAAEPTLLVSPTAAAGRLLKPRQLDKFRVPLKKGQQVVFAVEARSIESPVQPVLRLTDPTGAVVGNVEDPTPTRATLLAHAAAHDGDYTLTVRDKFRQTGGSCFYRLTARLEETDFELSIPADALIVTPEKPTELVVSVVRRAPGPGIGPITISAIDLPPGVSAPAVTSEPSGDTSAKVTLSFTTTGPAFSGPIRVQGSTTVPQELTRYARTPLKLGGCFQTLWLTAVEKK